jgi:putative endonuclease
MNNQYHVYILTTSKNTALYTGVTNDLVRRIDEHKNKTVKGFTSRYNIDKLVYYESTEDVGSAIAREKQIKGGSRKKKLDLIHSMNPEIRDLYPDISE